MKLTQKVGTALFDEKPKRAAGSSRKTPEQEPNEFVDSFLAMMDRWHGHKEIWDDALDIQILQNEVDVRSTHKPKLAWGVKGTKYFSPSSANSDARELFMKLIGSKRDEQPTPPHQGRWRRIGTAFGDLIQKDLLFIEKHYKKEFGEHPPYKPEYIEIPSVKDPKDTKLFPSWEKFAQKIVWVDHKGYKIPILGQPDGILRYLPQKGKRVGLEIKSKQTTAAQTSAYSMKEPKIDHVKQCINYSIMYGTPEAPLDDFIIVYGNLSKKAWVMSEEDYKKSPDLRAFHVHVTEKDRTQLLDFYAYVMESINTGFPPKLDLEKWTFNNFKTACILSLSEEEIAEVTKQAKAYINSSIPEWKKSSYKEALEFIEEVRKDA